MPRSVRSLVPRPVRSLVWRRRARLTLLLACLLLALPSTAPRLRRLLAAVFAYRSAAARNTQRLHRPRAAPGIPKATAADGLVGDALPLAIRRAGFPPKWRASVLHGSMLDSHGAPTVRSADAPGPQRPDGPLQHGRHRRLGRAARTLPGDPASAAAPRKVRAPLATLPEGYAQASAYPTGSQKMPVQNWHPTGPVLRQQRIHLAPARESRALATVVRERRARVPVARASCPATSVAQERRPHLIRAWKLRTQPAPARERRAQAPVARASCPAKSIAQERRPHLIRAWKLRTQPAPARDRRAQAPVARAYRPPTSVVRERRAQLTRAWKLGTHPAPARERRAPAPIARAARPVASVARERQARALAARRAAAVLIQAPNVWSWAAQVSSAMT